MNLLLDTCTILWLQLEPSRVPASLREILLKPETRRYASSAAAWKIAIKWSLARLPLPVPPQAWQENCGNVSPTVSMPGISTKTGRDGSRPRAECTEGPKPLQHVLRHQTARTFLLGPR